MKTIIIAGASGGIGNSIAKKLDKSGNRLILLGYKNEKALTELSKNLKCESCVFLCNLSNYNETKKLFDDIMKKYRKIDALISSVGVSKINLIQDVSENEFDYIMNSNFKSNFNITKFVSKNMISNKSGKIVYISSMWGKVGASCESVYSASKGALNSFALSIAKELAPSNINVNVVSPGLIDTKMNINLSKETIKQVIEETPLNRIGKPSDVANLVEYLISEKASFITGQIISIDGGFSM